jgi:hypothetical protein
VLDLLRARLEKAGFTRRDKEWREVPHTLMFVQAGETIRRVVDPKHEPYGVVAKYYDKVRPIADVEIPAWTAYLDGKTTREEAVEKILAAVRRRALESMKPSSRRVRFDEPGSMKAGSMKPGSMKGGQSVPRASAGGGPSGRVEGSARSRRSAPDALSPPCSQGDSSARSRRRRSSRCPSPRRSGSRRPASRRVSRSPCS